MSNEILEFDVVAVVANNPEVPEAEIGDRATVLMVYRSLGRVEGVELECVLPNGSNKWQGVFSLSQINLVQKT